MVKKPEELNGVRTLSFPKWSVLLLSLAPLLMASTQELSAQMPTGTAVIETAKGTFRFTVERAETPDDRSRGLMYRRSMPADHGMMFTWDNDTNISMWMANTVLPLDMVFIKSNGRVHRVHENAVPFSRDHIPAGAPIRQVLELNAGTAERIGLKSGDKVTLE